MPYRFEVSEVGESPFSDHFYFEKFPSRNDILSALNINKELAGPGYEGIYASFLDAVKKMKWPNRFAGNLVRSGGPIYLTEEAKKINMVTFTWDIEKFQLKRNY